MLTLTDADARTDRRIHKNNTPVHKLQWPVVSRAKNKVQLARKTVSYILNSLITNGTQWKQK